MGWTFGYSVAECRVNFVGYLARNASACSRYEPIFAIQNRN